MYELQSLHTMCAEVIAKMKSASTDEEKHSLMLKYFNKVRPNKPMVSSYMKKYNDLVKQVEASKITLKHKDVEEKKDLIYEMLNDRDLSHEEAIFLAGVLAGIQSALKELEFLGHY